jgi:hypothetical protein
MAAFVKLPDILRNGPEEVGLAAGQDSCKDPKCALMIDGVNPGLVAFKNVAVPSGTSEVMEAAYRLGAFAVANWGWMDEDCNFRDATADESSNVATVAEVEQAQSLVTMEYAVLLLISTKVTYYQMNHHVGQGVYAGFASKVSMVTFGESDYAAYKDLHWQSGHWVSTKACLFDMGFTSINRPNDVGRFPKATRDIRLRLDGAPAGCAKLYDTVTAMLKCSSTAYAKLVPPPMDLEVIAKAYKSVRANRLYFHVGSKYLHDGQGFDCYQPEESTLALASAFIHGAYPGSSLSKNKTLPKQSEVLGDSVYTNCNALRTSLTVRKLTKEELNEIIGGMTSRDLKEVDFAAIINGATTVTLNELLTIVGEDSVIPWSASSGQVKYGADSGGGSMFGDGTGPKLLGSIQRQPLPVGGAQALPGATTEAEENEEI